MLSRTNAFAEVFCDNRVLQIQLPWAQSEGGKGNLLTYSQPGAVQACAPGSKASTVSMQSNNETFMSFAS